MITVGDYLPGFFKLTAVSNTTGVFNTWSTAHLRGGWSVIVAWPKDFTFVCPTEVVGYGVLVPEFNKRNAQLFGLSTDSDHVHLAWRRSREDLAAVDFPWLSDQDHSFSKELGILRNGVCMRATFIVDPNLVVRHVTVNDDSVGRNPMETLRVLDALQTEALTPCGWKKGDRTL